MNVHPQADEFLPTCPLVPVHGASLDQDNVRTPSQSSGACSGSPGGSKNLGVGCVRVDAVEEMWLQANPFPLMLPLVLSVGQEVTWENSRGQGLPGIQQPLGHLITALPL